MHPPGQRFSALQRAENSSIRALLEAPVGLAVVSVLFSEPKIPQSRRAPGGRSVYVFQCSSASRKFLNSIKRSDCRRWRWSFSALQRAENSSICKGERLRAARRRFQCSSASRKFLNVSDSDSDPRLGPGFSALQRAENSSISEALPTGPAKRRFQCSSASRKFLNRISVVLRVLCRARFSALQRAENSSITPTRRRSTRSGQSFSALQRAENSSMEWMDGCPSPSRAFQCSSASRKFLNSIICVYTSPSFQSFSALQRAENSSIVGVRVSDGVRVSFSALQRAENSSIA